MSLFPDAIKRIHFFKRFFVFDPNDLKINQNILPSTNFYFDYSQESAYEIDSEKKAYFFGTYINYRMDTIFKLTEKLTEIGFEPDISIVAFSRDNIEKYKDSKIKFLNERISFEENIKNAKQSDILIDIVNGKHKGLSFRTFDAIGYEKKLITTNSEVRKYDFYHPNNFFILEENNLGEIEDFLKKPFVKLDDSIKLKYSFTNWIHYMLDIQPYQVINLPNNI